MRVRTKKKNEMGRRFAILIGLAATGVIALGAQTASSTTGDPVDSTPPDLQLSGPKKQDPQNAELGPGGCDRGVCSLVVRVSCGDEACTALVTGKLTKVKMDKLPPVGPVELCAPAPSHRCGAPRHVPPDLGPWLLRQAQRREVRKALDEGENVKAKVTVKATDAAGNVATAKRTITLVK